MTGSLTLLVHDYDPAAVQERWRQLEAVLPDATVVPFPRRDVLLAYIADLDPAPPLGPWPLALIDLQGEGPEARGEHLLATINEHPDLTGRVALVAFTRYNFEGRDESLRAMGARAVLSPRNLRRQKDLRRGLELLAQGSTDFARIGEPPSRGKDQEAMLQLAQLFPELADPDMDEQVRWERAREILHICRLDHEGYDDKAIKAAMGLERRRRWFDGLRKQLTTNRVARAADLVPPAGKAKLGKVIEFLHPQLDETELIWEVTEERNRLRGTGRIDWARDRISDRYQEGVAPDELQEDDWIPPTYLQALRRFLAIYDELPKRSRGGKKADPIDAALAQVAEEMEIDFDRANHYVTHAVMCLEDAEYEREKLAA
jgi:hypothetical protein